MAARKRELISPRGEDRSIRRDSKGRIVESGDRGRFLAVVFVAATALWLR